MNRQQENLFSDDFLCEYQHKLNFCLKRTQKMCSLRCLDVLLLSLNLFLFSRFILKINVPFFPCFFPVFLFARFYNKHLYVFEQFSIILLEQFFYNFSLFLFLVCFFSCFFRISFPSFFYVIKVPISFFSLILLFFFHNFICFFRFFFLFPPFLVFDT